MQQAIGVIVFVGCALGMVSGCHSSGVRKPPDAHSFDSLGEAADGPGADGVGAGGGATGTEDAGIDTVLDTRISLDTKDAWVPLTACPTGLGPSMLLLPPGFCIDSTEVTWGQYKQWLATSPSVVAQEEQCNWNDSFHPAEGCQDSFNTFTHCDPPGCEDYPVVCIDWCDANAFCRSAGKRLCGKIGGGPSDYGTGFPPKGDEADAKVNQWYNACSSGGLYAYPYSYQYLPYPCNGADYWGVSARPLDRELVSAGTLDGCQSHEGGYRGVYDLSGNAIEWVDACKGGDCLVRGGDFDGREPDLACARRFVLPTYYISSSVGFRCCAD